jgi:hypothetical protein
MSIRCEMIYSSSICLVLDPERQVKVSLTFLGCDARVSCASV